MGGGGLNGSDFPGDTADYSFEKADVEELMGKVSMYSSLAVFFRME